MLNPLSKKSREIGKKVTLLIEGSPSANKTDLRLQCLLLNKYTLSRVKYFITVTVTKVYCKLVSVCVHPTAKVKKMLKLAQRNAQDTQRKCSLNHGTNFLPFFVIPSFVTRGGQRDVQTFIFISPFFIVDDMLYKVMCTLALILYILFFCNVSLFF